MCIRNYKINRQRCFLMLPTEVAGAASQKTYRFSEVKIDPSLMPRPILDAPSCRP